MTAPSLTEFLLARIAEDESVARHATVGPWRYDPMKMNSIDSEELVFAGPSGPDAICVASTGPENGQSMIDARHIATHDPSRVLAECEAKRRIVDEAERVVERDDFSTWLDYGPGADPAYASGIATGIEWALRVGSPCPTPTTPTTRKAGDREHVDPRRMRSRRELARAGT